MIGPIGLVYSDRGRFLGRASYALTRLAMHHARGRAAIWLLAVFVPDYRPDRLRVKRGRWDRVVEGEAEAGRLVQVIFRQSGDDVSPAGET